MQLADWMIRHGYDDQAMANLISKDGSVKCERTQVNRYRRRLRRPDWHVIARIEKITKGQVTASDFIRVEAAE